jgi:hypothetical protein
MVLTPVAVRAENDALVSLVLKNPKIGGSIYEFGDRVQLEDTGWMVKIENGRISFLAKQTMLIRLAPIDHWQR